MQNLIRFLPKGGLWARRHQAITFAVTIAVLVLIFTGCHSPGRRFNPYIPETYQPLDMSQVKLTNHVSSDLLKPSGKPFTLGPGDRLEIEVLGDVASRTATAVGPDGKIYFHLLPGIDVWGLTLPETKTLIEKQLTEFIKEPPTVSITLRGVESRRVWLLGRFTTPGVYSMVAPMTILEAIAMAGGTMTMTGTREAGAGLTGEEIADLRRAFIIRKGERLPVNFKKLLHEGDLSQNIYLEAGDFVYFPTATAREVTVLGAVGQPRSVPYFEGMTLVGAIAHAGGTIEEAYWNHVALVRGSLSEPYVAVVNYKAMAQGRAPDVPVEPGDIIYVPLTPYRYLTRYAELIVNTFVGSVAINEGTRAVIRDAGDTQVVVPLQPVSGGATPVVR